MKLNKARRLRENYDKPTPIKWRRIGDRILLIGSAISGISAYVDNKYIAIAGIGLTALGKLLTNFAHEKDNNN